MHHISFIDSSLVGEEVAEAKHYVDTPQQCTNLALSLACA